MPARGSSRALPVRGRPQRPPTIARERSGSTRIEPDRRESRRRARRRCRAAAGCRDGPRTVRNGARPRREGAGRPNPCARPPGLLGGRGRSPTGRRPGSEGARDEAQEVGEAFGGTDELQRHVIVVFEAKRDRRAGLDDGGSQASGRIAGRGRRCGRQAQRIVAGFARIGHRDVF